MQVYSETKENAVQPQRIIGVCDSKNTLRWFGYVKQRNDTDIGSNEEDTQFFGVRRI